MPMRRIFNKKKYKEKEDAKKALEKYGQLFGLTIALNRDNPREGSNHSQNNSRSNSNPSQNHKPSSNSTPPLSTAASSSSSSQSMEKLNPGVFHLILSNLPKNYTTKDINSLVEEAKPLCINPLEETKVFNLKYCHIVLESADSLNYLINKLDGFVISGEKIIAVEAKHLLEWKEKVL